MFQLRKYKRLFENILSLSILQLLNLVLPLIVLPYLMKVVGKANYGSYAVAYSIVQYIVLVSAYGFGFSVTRQISQNRENRNKLITIFSSTIIARVLLALAVTIPLFTVAYYIFGKEYAFMTLMGMGIVLGDILNPVWLYQGMENMKFMTIVNFFSKFFSTLLVFIIIRRSDDYIYIIAMDSVGYLLAGTISFIMALKVFNINFCVPGINDIIYQLKDGWYIFWSTIFMTLYRSSNIFILRFFVSDAAIGVYAGAEKVIKAGQAIGSPISTALFPNLSASFKTHTIQENLTTLAKTLKLMSGVLGCITICIFVFSPMINNILLNGEQDGTITLIRIMTPVIIIGGLNYILGIVGLINLGGQKAFFKNVMVSGFISIVFLLSTVSFIGNISAGISMGVAEIGLFIMCCYSLNKIKNKS